MGNSGLLLALEVGSCCIDCAVANGRGDMFEFEFEEGGASDGLLAVAKLAMIAVGSLEI